ncbi:hypothetical protein [Nocardia sp. XZ_19_385]|uniref:hypothetical protein n=1 Tax=Nocardia sp. XZ_19_385 TaxID=2769488 RepID=UPI00188F1A36|nr:hypothetical protein [Nocardia sp. XZ_19_385]
MSIIKSTGAVVAGLAAASIASLGTDAALKAAGVLPHDHLYVGVPLVLTVIGYRTVFNILGAYLTASLAPRRPLKHAVILGGIGTFFSAFGAVATYDMDIGPHYYALSLVVLAMPSALLGGYLQTRGRAARVAVA